MTDDALVGPLDFDGAHSHLPFVFTDECLKNAAANFPEDGVPATVEFDSARRIGWATGVEWDKGQGAVVATVALNEDGKQAVAATKPIARLLPAVRLDGKRLGYHLLTGEQMAQIHEHDPRIEDLTFARSEAGQRQHQEIVDAERRKGERVAAASERLAVERLERIYDACAALGIVIPEEIDACTLVAVALAGPA